MVVRAHTQTHTHMHIQRVQERDGTKWEECREKWNHMLTTIFSSSKTTHAFSLSMHLYIFLTPSPLKNMSSFSPKQYLLGKQEVGLWIHLTQLWLFFLL